MTVLAFHNRPLSHQGAGSGGRGGASARNRADAFAPEPDFEDGYNNAKRRGSGSVGSLGAQVRRLVGPLVKILLVVGLLYAFAFILGGAPDSASTRRDLPVSPPSGAHFRELPATADSDESLEPAPVLASTAPTLGDPPNPQPPPSLPLKFRKYASRPNPPAHVPSVSRVFAHVNMKKPAAAWNWNDHEISFGSADKYSVGQEIGSGKFSMVFKGVHIPSNDSVVLKVFRPDKSSKIAREVMVLQALAGGPHMIHFREAIQDAKKSPALVFDLVESPDWKDLYPTLTLQDVQTYFFQLFLALHHAHSHGIMHRDIKPHNFLIDPNSRKSRLIDWGLGEFYHPGNQYHLRVGTRYYKPPEILLGMEFYDYSLDIWMAGVVLGGLLFNVPFLLEGDSDGDQLDKTMRALGSAAIFDYIEKYQCSLPKEAAALLANLNRNSYVPAGLESLRGHPNKDLEPSPQALDLLQKLVVIDHQKRLSAYEAIQHPFFDSVRAEYLANQRKSPRKRSR